MDLPQSQPFKMRVTNSQLLGIASNRLQKYPLDFEMILRPIKKDRSSAQNALYWVWVGYVSDQLGYTKDEIHRMFKSRFLHPLFMAAPDRHSDYAETLDALKELKQHDAKMAKKLWHSVVSFLSITQCSVAEFTEFLNEIERYCNDEMGIQLPHPEDRYYEAMGQ